MKYASGEQEVPVAWAVESSDGVYQVQWDRLSFRSWAGDIRACNVGAG
jgi:hypothetical protein